MIFHHDFTKPQKTAIIVVNKELVLKGLRG